MGITKNYIDYDDMILGALRVLEEEKIRRQWQTMHIPTPTPHIHKCPLLCVPNTQKPTFAYPNPNTTHTHHLRPFLERLIPAYADKNFSPEDGV